MKNYKEEHVVSSLKNVMNDMKNKPKKTINDVFELLASFIKTTLPVRVEEETKENVFKIADKVQDVFEKKEKIEPPTERVALPLTIVKSSQPSSASRPLKLFSSQLKINKQRIRKLKKLSTAGGNIVCSANGKELKKKIANHKMDNGYHNRRKGKSWCVLDDRELLKFSCYEENALSLKSPDKL